MPAHGGLHGRLRTAELAARAIGERLRVRVLLRVLLGVRVRVLSRGRVSRRWGVRAGGRVRVGTGRLVRGGTGGLLRVGPRRVGPCGRVGMRVRAVRRWRGGHGESP
ncbi:hypothetical protein ACIQU1_32565 [Streptomyces angustmyceticus]|uniref:hypothetical protein n=1 Tax=Streptomyces angustmyceticus TaxID=285578 RepID=UPI0037F684AA